MDSRDELIKTLQLLSAELQEERERFKSLPVNTPIATRKKEGVTWYPVVIASEETGFGERLILEIERNAQETGPSMFQQGSTASLFSNLEEKQKNKPAITGVVIRAGRHSLKLAVEAEELPDWAYEGKIGLDLYFDERSYGEMAKAMNEVTVAEKGRVAQLRETLLGYSEPRFEEKGYAVALPHLNDSQNEAVNLVTRALDVAIIHGPPGTGKTTALVSAIVQTLKQEMQVLVCAPSNLAVDLLAIRLAQAGVEVLRLGHPARLSEEVLRHSLDEKMVSHAAYKELKQMRKDADAVRKEALKHKRKFGPQEKAMRSQMLAESKNLIQEARRLENFIVDDLFEKSGAIICTLVGAAGDLMNRRRFETVFIDEAAQALEPACWIPILKANRVIFAGDHCQLPPTVKSDKAMREGLSITLFEKTIQRVKADVMLRTQYRMNKSIMQFSSEWFYHSNLEAAPEVADITLPFYSEEDVMPVEFIDTAGTGFTESTNPESLSISNQGEAELLVKRLLSLLENLPGETGAMLSIGVISPYKDQVRLLEEKVTSAGLLPHMKGRLAVDTVDGFQGQERDMILISLVRSNDEGQIGFLADVRRMNVALTRARKKLVVIGDSATIGGTPFYDRFLDYVGRLNAHRTAWEFQS